jgi:hypothetical protein
VSTRSSDPRPAESLSALTRTLSEAFASEDGALLLARLQALSLAARLPTRRPRPARHGRIGVWKPRRAKGRGRELVRDPAQAAEWRFWADVERIAPKGKARVVLLGESVARGYLYDPALTPAGVLASMMPRREVVDLARTDLTMTELGGLLGGLHALEPDAIVLFAGNNWHNVGFELTDVARLAAAVRERGFAGSRRVFTDEMVVPRARALLDALAATARGLGAKVVVVVPEFNLRDWRSEPTVLAPVLPGEDNVVWMAAHGRGQEAMGRGDLEAAAAAAATMINLDEGTSAASQEMLAAVLLAQGRTEEARARLEAARDAAFGLLAPHSPRCPAEVQDVLRAKSAEHGFALVDLPRVFARAQDGELPDRRLFLDYCHLTRAGIDLAMGEVAARLRRPGAPAGSRRPAPFLRPEDEAAAHFLAAIHNAHYGQTAEVLRHHCARALALAPAFAEVMRAYVDSHLGPGERWMSASFDVLSAHPAIGRYLSVSDPRLMEKLADFALIEAMVSSLEEAGVPARAAAARAMADANGPGAIDLLRPSRRATTFRERGTHALGGERAYVQAFTPTSVFFMTRPRAETVSFRLTCRLPGGRGEVATAIDGGQDIRLAVEEHWQTFEFDLRAPKGLSRVTLEWPVRPPPPDSLERAARRLERGGYPDVFPWFAEVHAFQACSIDQSTSLRFRLDALRAVPYPA